ncbi:sensor histidine kinase [Streptomyces sp. WMMB 322]|uniref:sensor histidine kinase n=1 Tax=Streptomyces sp. WMMB 322 TaxID=1286821 RepID=UPI000823771D|nr:histidine kinase [Streptomyces sp. WMMB 322]SCK17899.1 two-component system, NarL family, sensor histidine kinase DesK [Streptomyces sp. WMMB 322]
MRPAGTNTYPEASLRRGDTQERLRKLNLVMLLPLLAAAGVLTVALDARSWWGAVVLGLGVVTAVVAFVRWAAGDICRVALPCLVITAGVWLFGVLTPAGSTTAFFGLLVVGTQTVPQLPRHRGAAAVALSVCVAAVGALRLAVSHEDVVGVLTQYVIIPTGITAVVTGLMFPNKRFYAVVAELEESREREAELAVVRERMRFAGDLHDIQGHTLHVVKLKIALARKLLHSDVERVEQELVEVHALVGDTIAQTKELAHAQRRLNLSAELENAKNLFEAAGIGVRVERRTATDTTGTGTAGAGAHADELLGQVLRETTTNILRHAQATEVRITLSRSGITIVNDGAEHDPLPELRGLSVLRQRLADDGGELTVQRKDGRFLTAAVFPHARDRAGL